MKVHEPFLAGDHKNGAELSIFKQNYFSTTNYHYMQKQTFTKSDPSKHRLRYTAKMFSSSAVISVRYGIQTRIEVNSHQRHLPLDYCRTENNTDNSAKEQAAPSELFAGASTILAQQKYMETVELQIKMFMVDKNN